MPSDISRSNINEIFMELGKYYRKMLGKSVHAEIVIVGGAAILTQYSFREMSSDVDAIIKASSAIKDAAIIVEDRFDLEHNWLNSDFIKTDSYSPKIEEHSRYYRTFANVLEVRIVEPAYLIAMKLRSGREYKHDISDIVGILMDERKAGSDIPKESVIDAFADLYGIEHLTKKKQDLLDSIYSAEELSVLYETVSKSEKHYGDILKQFENDYPRVLSEGNVSSVLHSLVAKEKREAEKKEGITKEKKTETTPPHSNFFPSRSETDERWEDGRDDDDER